MTPLTSRQTSSLWSCGCPSLGLTSGLVVSSTLLLLSAAPVVAAPVAWQFDPVTQQLTLTLPTGVTPQYAVDAEAGQLVIDLPQTQLGQGPTEETYGGAVRRVAVTQATADMVRVVLDLGADTQLGADPVQVVSMVAGDQTRWVITPLVSGAIAQGPAPSLLPPNGGGMIVERPTIPAADPYLAFPAAGTGRLSTSAANLMLPTDIDNLANLPETLPIDPFNIGFAGGEQVSVPSLDELDATVGSVAAAPQITPQTTPSATTAPPQPDSLALTTPPPPAGAGEPVATEPTTPETTAPATPEATVPALPDLPPMTAAPTAPAAEPPVAEAPIDSETTGVPIAVQPSVTEALPPETPVVAPPGESAPAESVAAVPAEPVPDASVTPEPAIAAPSNPSAPVIAQEPPVSSPPATARQATPVQPQPTPTDSAVAIAVEPPPVAGAAPTTPPTPAPDQNLLGVPAIPTTTATVRPPNLPPEPAPAVTVAAGQAIPFGAPLPGMGDVGYGAMPQPGTANRSLSPDTLIAAGTVLALQYPGQERRSLGDFKTNEVMLLQNDIQDPMTNGILAPAGSQLIGHFEPSQQGQRWVSHTLITPQGQRVPLASNTEYFMGPPDVDPGVLALGTGAGALAMTLLTGGFGAMAMLGGALMGATTVVGTSPHALVLEPNQVIHVQVIQDVPRAMPIATAPERSREWGTQGEW
jgi:hypothetical protein